MVPTVLRLPSVFALVLATALQSTLVREREPAAVPSSTPVETQTLATIVDVDANDKSRAALKVYDDWVRAAGADATLPADVMRALYAAAGNDHDAFKRVAFLIQKGLDGRRISDRHSVDMARVREAWIDATILAIGERNGWRIARSDSGNTASGMKSDLDQTFYVWTWDDAKGVWKRAPEFDKTFIERFRTAWKEQRPVTLDALDVASIEGRNRFPDPRDLEVTIYWDEYKRTLDELGRTPGAYKTQGAVVAQMQFRALAEILKGNTRAFQVYGAERPGERWAKQPFDADDAVRTMFGIEPELMPGFAFGAALANFIELQHYLHEPKFETKYHLRTWEDSVHVLYLSEFALGKEYRVEYGELDAERRRGYDTEILARLFPGEARAGDRRRHHEALEVSNALRLLHKNKRDAIDALRDVGAGNPELDQQRIFEPLAREMFGERYDGSAAQIEGAVAEHRRLAAEFGLEAIFHSSEEAFQLLLDPRASAHALDPDRYRHLLADVPEAQWAEVRKRMGEGAQLTFLFGLHALGEDKARELVARLETKYPAERTMLASLWRRAGLQQGADALAHHPLAQVPEAKQAMSEAAPELARRAQHMALAEIGFELEEPARRIATELAQRHMSWNPSSFAHEAFLDPGNLDALANIVRVFVASKGDMEQVLAAALDELLLAVPVGGQLVAASRGGISGAALMAAAVRYPVLGYGLLAVGIGEAGYALFDIEYAQPVAANVEDAVYRGFVGPAQRSYGGEPATFGDADAEELTQLKDELRRIRLASAAPFLPISAAPDPALAELRAAAAADEERARIVLEPRIATLEEKRRAWEEFRDESWAGGYWTEGGAQKEQKPFRHGLLANVQPVISYSAGGLIDFRARFDPARDATRLAELEARIAVERDGATLLRLQAERDELTLQRARALRARSYLMYARTGRSASDPAAPFTDDGIGVPELMHKLQRDSLYPWFLERWAAQSREARPGFVPDTATFVDEFFARHHDDVVRECLQLGLLGEGWLPSGDLAGALPRGERVPLFPADSIDALKLRLHYDVERSKTLWEEFQRIEKRRAANEARALARRLEAYEAQAAGVAADGFAADPDFEGFLAAVRLANVPRSAPRVESTTWRRSSVEEAPAGSAPGQRKLHLSGAVQLRVDPTLYRPPYTATVQILRSEQVASALQSGTLDGEPLLPETRALLQQSAAQKQRELQSGGYFALTRAFAASMPDLAAAPPATVRGLPGLRVGARGRVRNASTAEPRVLIGENLAFGTLAQEAAPARPPEPAAQVPPLSLSKLDLSRTWSEVQRGKMANGSTRTFVGTKGDSAKLTTPLARGACNLPDAKVQMTLALEVPEQIEPDKDFALRATLVYGVASQKGAVELHLVLDGVAQRVSLVQGNGELRVACDYPYREMYPKSTEWNFMHDRSITAGEREDTSTSGRRAMHYQIKHDAPSFDDLPATARERGDAAAPGGVPGFIHATTNGFRISAEAKRGDELLLKLDVYVDHDLKGGVKLTPAAGGGAGALAGSAGSDPGAAALPSGVAGSGDGAAAAGGAAGSNGASGSALNFGASGSGGSAGSGDSAGSGVGAAADPAPAEDLLALARPWENERVRQIIDEWLQSSRPGIEPSFEGDTRVWRWTEWGVMESPPSVQATGAPDHDGMSRHEYLFKGAARLQSRRHFTLREHLERRLRGESGIDESVEESFGELLGRSSFLRDLIDDQPESGATFSGDLAFLSLAPDDWLGRMPEYDGRVVLLLVNSSTAAGGEGAARDAQAKWKRYGPAGLEVVEVLGDAAPAATAFAQRTGAAHAVGFDAAAQIAAYFSARALPSAVLFDRIGTRQGEAAVYDAVALDARVRALLGAAAPDPWVGTWKGRTRPDDLPLDLELAIGRTGGGYELLRSKGQLVTPGAPQSGAFERVGERLRIWDHIVEQSGASEVDYFEGWSLALLGTDRLRLERRATRDALDWSQPAALVFLLDRIDATPAAVANKK